VEDRKRPELAILKGFFDWLQGEAPRKIGNGKGFALKSSHVYLAALTDFMSYHDLPVDKRRLNLPRPTREQRNRKINIRCEQVKKLVSHAKSVRDRAVILCLWQSGMSIGDLLGLNVGDVMIEDPIRGSLDDPPLLIKLVRSKAGVDYRTFFGRDSCKALKDYLAEREQLIGKPKRSDPLFLQQRKRGGEGYRRLTTGAVEMTFKRLARRTGLVSEERMKEAYLNPARPHALRSGFASALKENGVNQDVIDGLQGHSVSYDSAYHNFTDKQLRELYEKHEDILSIEQVSIPREDEIQEAVRKHFGELGVERIMPELENTLQRLDSRVSRVEERIEKGITDALLGKLVADPQFRSALEESIVKVAREIVSKPWKELDREE